MSAVVIIAIVVVALIVLAVVAVYARRRVEQRQVLRERLASEAVDIVKRQTPMPLELKRWARKPMFCAATPPSRPPSPRRRPPAPRSWAGAPGKPSNRFPTRAKAPTVTTKRRPSSRKSSSLN
jgi:type II secretory pathway pseudopilin PulG